MKKFEIPKISHEEININEGLETNYVLDLSKNSREIKDIEDNAMHSQIIGIQDAKSEIADIKIEFKNSSKMLKEFKGELSNLEEQVKEKGKSLSLLSQIKKKEESIEFLRTVINRQEKRIKEKENFIKRNLIDSN